jgi:Fe-Mn family superoxide dismutase
LAARIDKQWGSFEAFKAEFEAKGVSIFGSGWVWLAADKDGTLSILQCPGADNPVAHGLRPLLTFDVWEHAYYLDFQNRRADHLKALWQIVDWKVVEGRY